MRGPPVTHHPAVKAQDGFDFIQGIRILAGPSSIHSVVLQMIVVDND